MITTERADLERSLLARLKSSTASAHARIDSLVDLTQLNLPRYRLLLGGLRDAHSAIEHELARHSEMLTRFGYDPRARSKLASLDADLAVLGDVPSARVGQSYSLIDVSEAFGAVYVVEGATLGGQVIARHVMPMLSLTPETGCRFFVGDGERTGDEWRATRDAIGTFAAFAGTEENIDRMIEGANATFDVVYTALHARLAV